MRNEEENMSDLDHRVGVSEVNLVSRKLQLKGLTEFNREKIVSEINEAFGIDSVTLDIKDCLLHIAYDVTHIKLDAIEQIIIKHDADISDAWWNRLKVSYYKFVEQNMVDNAKHKPWSCHQAPPRSKKHKYRKG